MSFLNSKFQKAKADKIFLRCEAGDFSYADILELSKTISVNPNAKIIEHTGTNIAEIYAKMLLSEALNLPLFLGKAPEIFEAKKQLAISTSGTSGTPKIVEYDYSDLFKSVSSSENLLEKTWISSYSPVLFAGLSVFAQVLEAAGTLVSLANASSEYCIKAVENLKDFTFSATPSWLKNFLYFNDIKNMKPERIVLGGEAVRQNFLDFLSAKFPYVKISHIYASSELGQCFVVQDKLEGIPLALLHKENFIIEGNELCKILPDKKIFQTGDLVEIANGRAVFIGRNSELINVGGHKVSPIKIEKFFEEIEGVQALRAYPEKSSLAGEIVALDIVCAPTFREAIENTIRKIALEKLDKYERPRTINFVKKIEISNNGKIVRR